MARSKTKDVIQAEAVSLLELYQEANEGAEPIEKLRFYIRIREEYRRQMALAVMILTGKRDEKDKIQVLENSVADVITSLWGELNQDGTAVLDDETAGEGMVWRIETVPSNYSGLDRELLLMAGVTPEQLTAGTKTSSGTRLDIRAVRRDSL